MNFKIFDINIERINYSGLRDFISFSINNNKKKLITYVTAASLNIIYENPKLTNIYHKFDLIHPDGVGVFWASKFLFGKKGASEKITGSDFYPILEEEIIKNKWRIFFFGETDETLNKLLDKRELSEFIVGFQNGFDFQTERLIKRINSLAPDILIVGIGAPRQEKWIVENQDNLNVKVILSVGEGIKVFAGADKVRGPEFIQKAGLEWLVRLVYNPRKFWRRYLIGIPLFIARIIILKLKKGKEY